MSDVQTNEPKQTQIDNQNIKTDDDASKYSSTTVQTDNRELDQTTTSNESTHDNPSTTESKATTTKSTTDATTSEPSSDLKHDTSTTQKPDSDTNNSATGTVAQETSSAPDLETSVTQTPDLNADKQALHTEVQQTSTTKPSTSETLDSDANKQSLPNEVQPDNTTKPSKAQIPDSDANKQSSPTEIPPLNTATPSAAQIPDTDANKQSSPTEVPPLNTATPSASQIPDTDANKQSSPTEVPPLNTATPSASQIPDTDANKQSLPNVVQPDNTTKPSETRIPESDANKQPSPTEVPSANTTTPSASQIPETNANKQSPPTEVQPINTKETLTTQETSTTEAPDSNANKQPLPTQVQQASHVDSSTTQLPDSGTNMQATKIPTDDSGESSNTKDVASDKETDPQKDDNGTGTKDTQNDEDKSVQERTQLTSLIRQELSFVNKIWPKLGEHQEHIKKEAEDASEKFKNFEESCEIKELKDLKKTVTKLKLQIPAKYRTYDENDLRKRQQSDVDKRDTIPPKLLKKMPRLHHELFNESQFCKAIQRRYSELRRQLKICLLCFSVFPENEIISRRLMVYWWIGEGLTPADEDKTAEDHANEIFNELIDNDFIEPVTKNHLRNTAACKMHPMVRAALIMIADKIKFFDFDEYGDPKDFGKFDEIDSPEEIPIIYPLGDPREFFDFYDENRQPTTKTIEFFDKKGNPIKFAALSSNEDWKEPPVDSNGNLIDTKKKHYFYRRKKITTGSYKVCLMGSGLSKGITWEKLHMLFNVKDDILEFKPEWFLRMKNVNVLFLGRWKSSAAHHIEVGEFDFKPCLEHMNHVRFFSLQGVSRISELPDSISNFESLIILDLRACHNLEVIPSTIGSLNFLTHLDMSECYLLKDIPKEISYLASLQVLKGFVVVDSPQRHVCTLQDLEKLKNLIKLSMYTHMKDFPLGSHLDALQKFEMLRKLTILWGGHETKRESNQSETAKKDKKKGGLVSRVRKMITKKNWVQGSLRRMNAFNNSTLGSRLEKLDLKCFPHSATPIWLSPASLPGLKKLYIRGGQFSDLGQYQDIDEVDDSPIQHKQTWNVEVLRLKYLDELKMEWTELQTLFPNMASLEKVKCPGLTLFPCNERGVWNKEPTTT
ncbi:hypothetical protein CTI12_AA428310 [Artemisia annua]|uniref:NB-ARC domains-containing protein n=1 Tax=Artemisia annua TaxID=35608 RepID=A0A2U1M2C8_ARTAN|nr:hypothetical protein CTI12_AA428310 [Artemisia annua]